MSKTSHIIQQKNAIRDFWFESRATAFCPDYWLLDYKHGRRTQRTLKSLGFSFITPIIDQTYYTHKDVHGK